MRGFSIKQIVIVGHGGPENLQLRESPYPAPAGGEIRIRVQASGINFPTSSRNSRGSGGNRNRDFFRLQFDQKLAGDKQGESNQGCREHAVEQGSVKARGLLIAGVT